jgi:hypothetical protein
MGTESVYSVVGLLLLGPLTLVALLLLFALPFVVFDAVRGWLCPRPAPATVAPSPLADPRFVWALDGNGYIQGKMVMKGR